jgi:D-alanine-D-alanine ligase
MNLGDDLAGRRKRIAMMFGGASPEFDVSVVTAQQAMDALDPEKYEVVPVFLDFENRLFTGQPLRNVGRFHPLPSGLDEIAFGWGERGPELRFLAPGKPAIAIDCAMPIFHGRFGEDGRIQGMLELVGVPFTGFSAVDSGVAMRKDYTKLVVADAGVPVLPHVLISRRDLAEPEALLERIGNRLPAIIKPASLGSSIGVGVAQTAAEVVDVARYVLLKDSYALIEPRVPNLVEYNIAVRSVGDEIKLSAIERPKPSSELLDFKEKYMSGGGGAKGSSLPSQGMLSLTREINPQLSEEMLGRIHRYARLAFSALGRRGAPRMDFLCDSKTGELWFNEINPIPGSYGFFLWEQAPVEPLLFPELLDHLIGEALQSNLKAFDDPVPQDAYLLPR